MTSEKVDMTEARAPETRGVASVRSNHESTIGPRNDKPELRLEKEVISVVTCGFTPTFHAGKSLLGKGTFKYVPGKMRNLCSFAQPMDGPQLHLGSRWVLED